MNEPRHPGEHVRALLQQRGWTQEELAAVVGRSRQHVIDILSGRSGITADMAIALAGAFGTSAEHWLKLDSEYRLAMAQEDIQRSADRAKLYSYPIRDMQRRGWIKNTTNTDEIASEIKRFFRIPDLDSVPEFPVSARKADRLEQLSGPQRAWCFRARELASSLVVNGFSKVLLPQVKAKLRECAAYAREARHLPKVLSEAGIRFVVVEPLPGAKIDGAAFWLEERSPVIAVSIRFDRIDAFWFTVMHELAHVESEDALSVDSDLAGEDTVPAALKLSQERSADAKAAAMLVPPDELNSFIRRVGPLYSKERITQFAYRIKMHPGIIVGQLQHLGEIGYSANREMLVKMRDVVTNVSLTDGWGRTVALGDN